MQKFHTRTIHLFFATVFSILFAASYTLAAEKEKPPLPLHGIEGYGGIAATYSAYLTNPAGEGQLFGKPSLGTGMVAMDSGKNLFFTTLTGTIGDRFEFGYGFDALALDDLPSDIQAATSIDISDDTVYLHNFNGRVALIKEGAFGRGWMPAVTFGVHYKYNDTVDSIDDDLGGTLTGIGIEDNDGVDLTLYASKMITALPRPILINAGLRNTSAAHIGLLGFTDSRDTVFEGNVVAFLTERLALGAEYRQKPDNYDEISGLVEEESDWWSVVAGYVVNNNLTVSGGYFNLGTVLNQRDNDALGLKVKYEF